MTGLPWSHADRTADSERTLSPQHDPAAPEKRPPHPARHPVDTALESYALTAHPPWRSWPALKRFMQHDVDSKGCVTPLVFYCFMTGYLSAVAFTACYIWIGFQTGNTVQLALSLAHTFAKNRETRTFALADKHAATSLGSFVLGTLIGRIGGRTGKKKRLWLVASSLLQACGTALACIMVHFARDDELASSRGNGAWTNGFGYMALASLSATLGLQGSVGRGLNTQFNTTVVLTTIWIDLINEPQFFKPRRISPRDQKVVGILVVFLGGFVARALMEATTTTVTLAIAVGLRILATPLWLLVAPQEVSGNVN